MPEYRRFIAYFYEYISGKKQKNAGFAKVELRNGTWRILFRLTVPVRPGPPVEVFGFVREQGYLLGLPMGTMRTGREMTEDWAYHGNEQIWMGTYGISDLSGIWIRSGDGRSFITVWDEESVDMERFVTELPVNTRAAERHMEMPVRAVEEHTVTSASVEEHEEMSVHAAEESAEISAHAVDQDAEISVHAVEEHMDIPAHAAEKHKEIPAHAADEGTEISVRAVEEHEEIPAHAAGEHEEISVHAADEGTEISVRAVEEHVEIPAHAAGEHVEIFTHTAEEYAEMSVCAEREAFVNRAAGEQEKMSGGSGTCTERKTSEERMSGEPGVSLEQSVWKELYQKKAQFRPFADHEISDCIRIAPNDVMRLRMARWKTGRNSFLLHGYYNYHHLMVGRTPEGRYVLGVPGVMNPQEKYLAVMFGFPNFKSSDEPDQNPADGYWYRILEQEAEAK